MSIWEELSPEQSAVLTTALEEAFLRDVMDEWRARIRWQESGNTLVPSDLDEEAKRALMPRFTEVVVGLVERGWIEVRGYSPDGHGSKLLLGDELRTALSDPAVWLSPEETAGSLALELITTSRWDEQFEK